MTVTFNDVEELGKRCDRLPTDFKIGDVRRMTSGMGSCWVRRPVDAGKKLINGGTTDHRRVVQLQGGDATCARPPILQMLGGHVQSKCTSLEEIRIPKLQNTSLTRGEAARDTYLQDDATSQKNNQIKTFTKKTAI
ncbi:hypothetical protein G5I_12193 [Acromyrmex echinatior]|uniref:Uncharacterized protein n=1 Tax=Acromyrmex echinatior TaxID=103372 RepID=F4X1M8_ACREC|nr:hypothetical protein G5I_12193 [Acromyrmex echinatior]